MGKKITGYDFSGYATKHNVLCSDGRTIMPDAFAENDGMTVPLVYQHFHDEPANVLGHALLENRKEGVYAYAYLNKTENGQIAKELVAHKDMKALSIFANQLVEKSKNVVHGLIREVSLVMAGANKGAVIDYVSFEHGEDANNEAVIHMDESDNQLELFHADAPAASTDDGEETVGEVFDTLSDKQKQAVYAIVAEAVGGPAEDTVAQSEDEEGDVIMHKNIFDGSANEKQHANKTLTHDEFASMMHDVTSNKVPFKQAFIQHATSLGYGIDDIELLFPDYKSVQNDPSMIQRQMEWVTVVLNGTNKLPFSRIRSLAGDITADEARARGYVKGAVKVEQVYKLLKRTTDPTTFYTKQKLDRDDIIDITDMDVVGWMDQIMLVMLNEELARQILVSDGRAANHADKINDEKIRPIWFDDDLYAHHVRLDANKTTEDIIEAIIRARVNYKGSGTPTMFTNTTLLTDMLLMKAGDGRRLYATQADLQAELRVSRIVEVPIMEALTRESADVIPVDLDLQAIIVNLKDYSLGATKGGQISSFRQFDIDVNQEKFLKEGRCSGALALPKSALVIEKVGASG